MYKLNHICRLGAICNDTIVIKNITETCNIETIFELKYFQNNKKNIKEREINDLKKKKIFII